MNGATVAGTLTSPNGFRSEIELLDDGIAPDLIAKDGSYSAEISYFQNGTHLIRVAADNTRGRAALTYNGTSRSPAERMAGTASEFEIVGTWDVFASGTVTEDGISFPDSDTF